MFYSADIVRPVRPHSLILFILLISGLSPSAKAMTCETKIRASGRATSEIAFSPVSRVSKYGRLVVISKTGECLKEVKVPVAIDFRPHQIQGKTYFSYVKVTEGQSHLSVSGPREILDSQLQPLSEIRVRLSNLTGPVDLDFHDFLLFDPDHFAGAHYLVAFDWLGRCRVRSRYVEIKDGNTVTSFMRPDTLSFNAHFELFQYFKYNGFYCTDADHLNSFTKTKAPLGVVLSYKGDNSVRYVSQTSVAKDWVLGGPNDEFGLPREAAFVGQHAIEWDESEQRLTLFDNGINSLFDSSNHHHARVLEFKLDLQRKTIRSWKVIAELPYSSTQRGNFERCGKDCVRITPGETWGNLGPNILEFNTKTMQTTFEAYVETPEPDAFIYRSYAVPAILFR